MQHFLNYRRNAEKKSSKSEQNQWKEFKLLNPSIPKAQERKHFHGKKYFRLSWFVNVCFPLIFHYQWKINGKMSPFRPSFPPSSSLSSPAHPLPSPPSTVGSAPGPKFSQSPAPLEILGDYGADHGGETQKWRLWGRSWGLWGRSGAPDRQWSSEVSFLLSKIDHWSILLRRNGAITFAINFFPTRSYPWPPTSAIRAT